MDLDQMLDQAAPPIAARTPDLHQELRALVEASEPAPRRRRSVRLAMAAGIAASAVGLGAVASTAGILPGWTMLTTSSGQTCEIEMTADLYTPGDGEPISATFSRVEQEETLAAARAFLEDFDFDSIDRQEAIVAWQAAEAEVRAAEPDPKERQEKLKGDDLEVHSVTWTVVQRMRATLAAQGHDIRAVSIGASTSGCYL